MFSALEEFHPRQQDTGIGGNGPPRLHDQLQRTVAQALRQRGHVIRRLRWLFLIVGDPQAAAHVQVSDINVLLCQGVDQFQHPVQCIEERRHRRELRADVTIHTLYVQVLHGGGTLVDGWRFRNVDAELVLFQPGGDIGMGTGVHVWVHTQGNRRPDTEFTRHFVQAIQFGVGFHIETANTGLEGAAHFPALLSNPGKDGLRRVSAGTDHPLQLSGRHDVKSGAKPCQHVQYGDIAVGLNGVAHQMRTTGKGVVIGAVMALEGSAGIDIGWRAKTPGNVLNRYVLSEQLTAAIIEVIHGFPEPVIGAARRA